MTFVLRIDRRLCRQRAGCGLCQLWVPDLLCRFIDRDTVEIHAPDPEEQYNVLHAVKACYHGALTRDESGA